MASTQRAFNGVSVRRWLPVGGKFMRRSIGLANKPQSEPRSRGTALLCVALFCAPAAWGQSSAPSKSDAAQSDDLKLGSLEISGNWRARVEGWDWFEASAGQNAYAFPHSLLRIAIGQRIEHLEWRVEAAQDAILFLPTQAVVSSPQGQLGPGGTYYAANGNSRNNVNGFVKQAYIEINRLGQGKLKLGRFEYFDGLAGCGKTRKVCNGETLDASNGACEEPINSRFTCSATFLQTSGCAGIIRCDRFARWLTRS
jgi:hypothetical protein